MNRLTLILKDTTIVWTEQTTPGPDPVTTSTYAFPEFRRLSVFEFFGDYYLTDAWRDRLAVTEAEIDDYFTRRGIPTLQEISTAFYELLESMPEEPWTGWDPRP